MIVGDVWDTREGPKRALKTITLGSDIVGYNYTDTKESHNRGRDKNGKRAVSDEGEREREREREKERERVTGREIEKR